MSACYVMRLGLETLALGSQCLCVCVSLSVHAADSVATKPFDAGGLHTLPCISCRPVQWHPINPTVEALLAKEDVLWSMSSSASILCSHWCGMSTLEVATAGHRKPNQAKMHQDEWKGLRFGNPPLSVSPLSPIYPPVWQKYTHGNATADHSWRWHTPLPGTELRSIIIPNQGIPHP